MEHRSIITSKDLECLLCDETAKPKALPLSLLDEITDGFSGKQQVGSGGFAVVYKGQLENRTVAVKMMFNAYMHEREFRQEVECLMMVKHKNIVRFLGYCADTQGTVATDNGKFIMADVLQRLLCFEYLPKGSLHGYITDISHGLQWRDRYQIITGICHGLHYLHQKNIVHFDLKPPNILLDDNLVPKIADFGLSRCFEEMQSRIITKVAGTCGYMAPELYNHTEIKYRHSPLLDIYSLGVIILEILTGNKELIGSREPTRNMAVDNVVDSWSNMVGKSQRDVQMEQVRVCVELGIECTDPDPAKRPNMQHIINRLDEIGTIDGCIETGVVTSHQAEDASSELHQDTPNVAGETSPEENSTALDCILGGISRQNLKGKIEMLESTISEVKQSPLLGVANKSTLDDINQNRSQIRPVGIVIAEKLQGSPAARVLGGIWTNPHISFSSNTGKLNMPNGTMDALLWSYQQLNPDIRRCFKYCSIFPGRSKLRRADLVRLWIAQGFVKTSCATEDIEDIAESYVQELVSCSFLQPDHDFCSVHGPLHDLLDEVAGCDYYRIENATGERWKGEIPHEVQHLFVQNYDRELIMKKIVGLANLHTLIINVVERDTPVEEKVIESICKRLPKLRVLAISFSQEHGGIEQAKIPESISQLKDLRYLAFRARSQHRVNLPSTVTELHHIELLDFGKGDIGEINFAGLINLRHIICLRMKCPNIGSLLSLQTMPDFIVRDQQGYELKQLSDLNKLRGSLRIWGLENVKNKEEALEANLGAKEGLTKLTLCWQADEFYMCTREVQAGVLEGLCPPVGLETLIIDGYKGSRCPDWMVGKQDGGPKGLQKLTLCGWSKLRPGPELEAFPDLRVLSLGKCSWDALPGNIEHLKSLKKLVIIGCLNIRSLPRLPRSLEQFHVEYCFDKFTKSCETVGHTNWQKIQHIRHRKFRCLPKRPIHQVCSNGGIGSSAGP